MSLYSVSIGDIEDDVTSYFSHRFGTDLSALTPATDVKQMYNFSADAWAQLGDTLSGLPWMRHLGVRLSHPDMMTVTTVGQLSFLIFSRMQHVVTAKPATPVTPVNSLMRLSPHALAGGTPKGAGKPQKAKNGAKAKAK